MPVGGVLRRWLRLLYLAWLRCVQSEEIADDAPEPSVPEFLRIGPDLIAAAAAGSEPAAAGQPTAAHLRTSRRAARPRQGRDPDRSDHRRRQPSTQPTAAPPPRRTPHRYARPGSRPHRRELLAAAAELHAERERHDAEQRERDRIRRERSAAAARQRHLDTLAVDQPAVWQRVGELIATKKPREYDTAVQLLVDLRDLGERDGDNGPFRQRLAELRAAHARKPSLLERPNLAGLDT